MVEDKSMFCCVSSFKSIQSIHWLEWLPHRHPSAFFGAAVPQRLPRWFAMTPTASCCDTSLHRNEVLSWWIHPVNHMICIWCHGIATLWLVGGLEHEFYFPLILGMSSSQLTFIFFKIIKATNQIIIMLLVTCLLPACYTVVTSAGSMKNTFKHESRTRERKIVCMCVCVCSTCTHGYGFRSKAWVAVAWCYFWYC